MHNRKHGQKKGFYALISASKPGNMTVLHVSRLSLGLLNVNKYIRILFPNNKEEVRTTLTSLVALDL